MKCMIENCINTDEQGHCIYITAFDSKAGVPVKMKCICGPCWDSLTCNQGTKNSQNYRNMVDLYRQSQKNKVEMPDAYILLKGMFGVPAGTLSTPVADGITFRNQFVILNAGIRYYIKEGYIARERKPK